MINKEDILEKLAKEDLQVLILAYVYAKNLYMYGEDVTKAIQSATENAVIVDKAYRRGYYDAIKIMAESEKPKTIQEKQAESEKYQKAFDDGYESGYAQARFDYEPQPCEDAISRAEILKKQYPKASSLKYLKPTYIVDVNDIESLPSVTPSRPKGKWIKIPITRCYYPCDGCVKNKKYANDEWCSSCEFWKIKDFDYKCSKCGEIYSEAKNYCSDCGADMRGDNKE